MTKEAPIHAETKDKDVPWWSRSPHFSQEIRDLIQNYAGVDRKEVDNHIMEFRDKAWEIRPYPCVGTFSFLKPVIRCAQFDHEYEAILQRLKAGDSLLNVGCAMAQDLRYLAADGAPTEHMFAADIVSEFWDASFDLFRDRATMRAHFFLGDVLDAHSDLAQQKPGAFDVLVCGDFFHLFDWEHQVQAGAAVVRLGRARAGTMIIGKQVGCSPGRPAAMGWGRGDELFFHDPDTFRRMWSEVEARTQTRWEVKVRTAPFGEGPYWSPLEDFNWVGEGWHGIQFVMTRL